MDWLDVFNKLWYLLSSYLFSQIRVAEQKASEILLWNLCRKYLIKLTLHWRSTLTTLSSPLEYSRNSALSTSLWMALTKAENSSKFRWCLSSLPKKWTCKRRVSDYFKSKERESLGEQFMMIEAFFHFGFPAELWKTRGWRRRRGCRISCRCRRPAQSCPRRPTPSCKTRMIKFHLDWN